MSAWKNLKVRLDTWDRVSAMAAEQSRSVSAMADLLLRRALESVLGNSPSEHPSTGAPAPSRAPAEEAGDRTGATDGVSRSPSGPARPDWDDDEAHIKAQRDFRKQIEGQTTVEEMLASCPNCATTLENAEMPDGTPVLVCPDCGYARPVGS